MDTAFAVIAMSTPSLVLRYAAAFFFVVVAVAAAYALVKAGKALGRVDKVLADVDREALPLLGKAGETLEGVNASLGNVDQITRDVADITDKIDAMAGVVETAVSTPARKAAAWSAGVQTAISSFLRREPEGGAAGASPEGPAAAEPSPAAAEPTPAAADAGGPEAAASGATEEG